MVEAELDTNTSSTERIHSENLRRSKFRVMTTSESVSDLSVWSVARQWAQLEAPAKDPRSVKHALRRLAREPGKRGSEAARLLGKPKAQRPVRPLFHIILSGRVGRTKRSMPESCTEVHFLWSEKLAFWV